MNFDMLYKGKERPEFTEYNNQLNDSIKALYQMVKDSNNFKGNIELFGDKLLSIQFNSDLHLSIVFSYQPNLSIVTFEKKHFDLTHIKLSNYQAIEFVKRLLNDQIYVIEHRNRLLTSLFPFLFVKIMSFEDYKKRNRRFLGKKSYKIYTGSKIIQP